MKLAPASALVLCVASTLSLLGCSSGSQPATAAPGSSAATGGSSTASPSQGGEPALAVMSMDTMDPALTNAAATQESAEEIKIRLSPNGQVQKVSVYHKDASALPQSIHQLVAQRFPGAQAQAYEQERYQDLGEVYEVEVKTTDGKTCELAAKADGSELYVECEIAAEALPENIRSAALAQVPNGKIVEAEHKTGVQGEEFGVEIEAGGREYEVVFRADGTLIRKAVEIEAEVEIVLQ